MTSKNYQVFSDDTECIGQVLIDFENAAQYGDQIHGYFAKHQLTDITPSEWYPYQRFLDVINDMLNSSEQTSLNLVSVGMKQVETAIIPDEYLALPIPSFLAGMNAAYQMNLRGDDIGEIQAEKQSDNCVKLTLRVPAPDDLWYGVVYGYMRRLTQGKVPFIVEYDASVTRRDEGGDVTVMTVQWE